MLILYIYLLIASVASLGSLVFDYQSKGGVEEELIELVSSIIVGLLWPVSLYIKCFGGKRY